MIFFFFLCDWENVNLQKEGKEKEKKKVSGADNMAADVAQQEHSNNKCCASVFFFLRESLNNGKSITPMKFRTCGFE